MGDPLLVGGLGPGPPGTPYIRPCSIRPYLAPYLRYSDIFTKNRKFFTPFHVAPSLGVTPVKFMEKLYGS